MRNTNTVPDLSKVDLDFLLANTTQTATGCLEWNKGRLPTGYGQYWITNKSWLVHRLVAMLVHGLPEHNQMALHSCDNPPCINPNHLSWGSHSENMKQMWARGRVPERPVRLDRKITFEDAEEARQLYAQGGYSYLSLGNKYGLSNRAMGDLLMRKTYKK